MSMYHTHVHNIAQSTEINFEVIIKFHTSTHVHT